MQRWARPLLLHDVALVPPCGSLAACALRWAWRFVGGEPLLGPAALGFNAASPCLPHPCPYGTPVSVPVVQGASPCCPVVVHTALGNLCCPAPVPRSLGAQLPPAAASHMQAAHGRSASVPPRFPRASAPGLCPALRCTPMLLYSFVAFPPLWSAPNAAATPRCAAHLRPNTRKSPRPPKNKYVLNLFLF